MAVDDEVPPKPNDPSSPEKEDGDSPKSEDASNKNQDGATAEYAQKLAAKRRTKTGCLTCRKRRIKCGEEKPVCKNCIKSKRDCAGYVQPLVYKQQTHAPQSVMREPSGRSYSAHDEGFPTAAYYDMRIQPAQPFVGAYPTFDPSAPAPYHQLHHQGYGQGASAAPSGHGYHDGSAPGHYFGWHGQPNQSPQVYHGIEQSGRVALAPMFHMPPNINSHPPQLSPFDLSLVNPLTHSNPHSTAITPSFYEVSDQGFHSQPIHHRSPSISNPHGALPAYIEDGSARRYSVHGFVQHAGFTTSGPANSTVAATVEHSAPSDDYEDPDDPYDIEMEEEDVSFQEAAQNLTEILDRSGQRGQQESRQPKARRAPEPIATFKPSMPLSPLHDERNERIFCHFVEVSSHCVSIFERHHFSPISAPARTLWNFTIPALALSHAALAHSILALGALHLAKLQGTSEDLAIKHFTYSVRRVGKLLGLPKRRHEIATLATVLVLGFYEVVTGDHSRWNLHLRGATRLVLEHDYAGLTRTARRMRAGAKARVNQWTAQFALTEENYARVAGIPLALLDDVDWEVNSDLIAKLTGLQVDYDQQFQPNFPRQELSMNLSDKDVDELKAKMDLRWWYCKQDIFQSMISGDPLLMPYENWVYCPPRGQIGRADNSYATLDHFMLVMARLTDFGGKDRHRKQKLVNLQGGQWKPPVWLFGPEGPPGASQGAARGGPGQQSQPANLRSARVGSSVQSEGPGTGKSSLAPSANEGRVRQSKPGPPASGPPSGPPMHGMIPMSGADLHVHSAFKSMANSIHDSAYQTKQQEREVTPPKSLEEETARAFAQHAAIAKAFDVFEASLGPEFEPLNHTGNQPLTTPFGPALIYRNPGVACIWLFYHVARILVWRLHPEMPPAAMVSAGATAHLTKDHAQAVGKICAGLYSGQHYGQSGALEPSFAGALMESTFQLLFAAVQFQDAAQRGWTIIKLQDVAYRCGWQTSGAVAAACEMAWERMGQAGRGPPYERTLDHSNKDARVSGVYSRSDGNSGGSPQDSKLVREHESEFVNHDRSLIDRSSSTRTHWALGLLSVEEDIKKMSLESE